MWATMNTREDRRCSNGRQHTDRPARSLEDTWDNISSGALPVSEMFRRLGEHMKYTANQAMRSPIDTLVPSVRPLGVAMKQASAFFPPGGSMTPQRKEAVDHFSGANANAPDPDVGPGRRYVDSYDKFWYRTVPGYAPRRDRTWRRRCPRASDFYSRVLSRGRRQ
jgi:hypothetical protein